MQSAECRMNAGKPAAFRLCLSFCTLHSALGSHAMPTFKYEAMDTSGGEVKDSVEAGSEEEAQQKIRQMGYFVTKITETSGKKDKKKKGGRKGKKGKVFTIGGCNKKAP